MKRVLFVDDEPGVLNGLRRMLRGMRNEWQTQFASSGIEALELLSRDPVDVIVSDMRMPGMDGAQLLNEVMRRFPEVVRIVLSGQADREAVLRSIGPAHQYLSKPCDEATLKATLARALALREGTSEPLVKQLVAKVTRLPSLPSLYAELVAELQSPNSSIQKVGQIISRDVGMTAKILQLVNSSYFGLRQRVGTPAQAAVLLGTDVLRALVLSVHVFSQFDEVNLPGFSIQRLFQHSLAVGTAARMLCKAHDNTASRVNDALVAGMLHDVGKLVLAGNLSELYARVLADSERLQIPLAEAEANAFGAGHAEVGAYLLGLWGLSDPLIEAVAFHHAPDQCPDRGFSVLTAVHVANVVEHQCNPAGCPILPCVDQQYLASLGMADRLPAWQELIQSALPKGAAHE